MTLEYPTTLYKILISVDEVFYVSFPSFLKA